MRGIGREWWFTSRTDSTSGQTLDGWRLWQAYCVDNKIRPGMKGFSNAGMRVAYFIRVMSLISTPFCLLKEA
jgi:hypothetical protein